MFMKRNICITMLVFLFFIGTQSTCYAQNSKIAVADTDKVKQLIIDLCANATKVQMDTHNRK